MKFFFEWLKRRRAEKLAKLKKTLLVLGKLEGGQRRSIERLWLDGGDELSARFGAQLGLIEFCGSVDYEPLVRLTAAGRAAIS